MRNPGILHLKRRTKREDWSLLFLLVPSLVFAIILAVLASYAKPKIDEISTGIQPSILGSQDKHTP